MHRFDQHPHLIQSLSCDTTSFHPPSTVHLTCIHPWLSHWEKSVREDRVVGTSTLYFEEYCSSSANTLQCVLTARDMKAQITLPIIFLSFPTLPLPNLHSMRGSPHWLHLLTFSSWGLALAKMHPIIIVFEWLLKMLQGLRITLSVGSFFKTYDYAVWTW